LKNIFLSQYCVQKYCVQKYCVWRGPTAINILFGRIVLLFPIVKVSSLPLFGLWSNLHFEKVRPFQWSFETVVLNWVSANWWIFSIKSTFLTITKGLDKLVCNQGTVPRIKKVEKHWHQFFLSGCKTNCNFSP